MKIGWEEQDGVGYHATAALGGILVLPSHPPSPTLLSPAFYPSLHCWLSLSASLSNYLPSVFFCGVPSSLLTSQLWHGMSCWRAIGSMVPRRAYHALHGMAWRGLSATYCLPTILPCDGGWLCLYPPPPSGTQYCCQYMTLFEHTALLASSTNCDLHGCTPSLACLVKEVTWHFLALHGNPVTFCFWLCMATVFCLLSCIHERLYILLLFYKTVF